MANRAERRRRERGEEEHWREKERTADLSALQGCEEAHQAQAELLRLSGRKPIRCPHCGEAPAFDDLDD